MNVVPTWKTADIAAIKKRLKWADAVALAYINSLERDNATLQRTLLSAVNKVKELHEQTKN